MSMRIISTGGTFEKGYDPVQGALHFDRSQIPDVLARARAQVPWTELMQIDSLDMTDTTRARLVDACRAAPETQIVVVHGTDTMVESARALAAAQLRKAIVLTGAMVPLRISGTDAEFNLGYALAAAQLLSTGVWVAMNAKVHPWNKVQKNRALSVFESK